MLILEGMIAIGALIAVFAGLRLRQARLALPAPAQAAGHPQDYSALRHLLSKLQYEDGLEKPALQGVEQLAQAQARYELFRKILLERMEPGEITFERYDASARAVREGVIDQLRRVSESLQQWVVAGSPKETQAAFLGEATRLLESNAKALAGLDSVTSAVRAIRTTKTGASVDLQGVMQELEALAARAGKYST